MKLGRCLHLPALLLALIPWCAYAQLPVVNLETVFPPGGKIGTSVEVTITGNDLDDPTRLLFSHPGITAEQKEPNKFIVKIGEDVKPGIYDVRLRGHFGISNPRGFVVGQLEEILEEGTHHSISSAAPIKLESVVNGRADASNIDHFKFTAQQGERILIRCEDDSIDSRMDGSLVLRSPDGTELARSRSGGLLDFTAQTTGEYIVQIYDFLYQGGADYFYRLSVSTLPHIDFILPPSGMPGSKGRYTLYGRNLPAGQPVDEMTLDGHSLQKLVVEIELPHNTGDYHSRSVFRLPYQAVLDGIEYRLPTPKGFSNPVFIGFATAPVTPETKSNELPDLAQEISVPCEYTGQFWPARDQDWITFQASKGEVYIIELFSHRLGVHSNPFALLQKITKKEDGTISASDLKEIYPSDDNIGGNRFQTLTRDPAWRFEVKEDSAYRIQIVDLFNQAEPRPDRIYRLSIRHEQPDFRLVAMSDPFTKDKKVVEQENVAPRRGQTIPVKVLAFRRDNFEGPIEISVKNPPAGLHCTTDTITGKESSATLLLTAAPDAAVWDGPLQVVGKARINNTDVTREAIGGGVNWTVKDANNAPVQSRLTDYLAVAICDEPAPIVLQAGEGQPLETSVAGKLKIPVKVVRNAAFNEKFKIKPTGHNAFSKAKDIEIDGKAETAEYELDLVQAKLGAGTYQLYFQTETKGKYRNNPEVVAQLEADAQTAAAALEEAKKAAAQADEERKKTEVASKLAAERAAKATQNLSEADAAANEAAARLEELKRIIAEAEAKVTATREARIAAEQASQEAAAQVKTAEQTQAKAQETAAQAAAKIKAAEEAKNEAEKIAKAANDRSKPRDLTIPVYSTPFTVKVTPAPITLSPAAPPGSVAQGAKLEFPVSITRRYGYADPVDVNVIVPKELKGLRAAQTTINKDASQTTVSIEAAEDTPLGEQQLTVEAKLKLNGQEIKVTQPLKIQVVQPKRETTTPIAEKPPVDETSK